MSFKDRYYTEEQMARKAKLMTLETELLADFIMSKEAALERALKYSERLECAIKNMMQVCCSPAFDKDNSDDPAVELVAHAVDHHADLPILLYLSGDWTKTDYHKAERDTGTSAGYGSAESSSVHVNKIMEYLSAEVIERIIEIAVEDE